MYTYAEMYKLFLLVQIKYDTEKFNSSSYFIKNMSLTFFWVQKL